MKQSIQLTLGCNLAIGEVTLNEIVYKLKEFSDCVMLKVLEKLLMSYDDLIAERLSQTTIYGPPARKGLGRHLRKGDVQSRFCRGRKVRKRGYRKHPRVIATVFGKLKRSIRIVECRKCGNCYSPLLD